MDFYRMIYFYNSAEKFYKENDYINAISRMYYAVYHTMCWRLISTGFTDKVTGHKNIRVQFSSKFSNVSEKFILNCQKLREKVDYKATKEMEILTNELYQGYNSMRLFVLQQQQLQQQDKPTREYIER